MRINCPIIPARHTELNPHMHDQSDPGEQRPSKTRLKREAEALQQLGADLLAAPESAWRTMQLPEELINALLEARRIRSRGARKRQLQYIGKLMRSIDPEPIRQYFEQLRLENRRQAQRQHALEAWRDRLIAEGDPAIEAFLHEHPGAERQQLRRLVRQVKKEQALGQAPASSRALFRYIRDIGDPP
jgi:ribosome-associated protein